MRVLVIFAHPLENSYAAALRNVVVETLSAGGHKVALCDLYKEAFDPVMSARERSVYKDTANNLETVREYVERLRQAEGVIFVFPTGGTVCLRSSKDTWIASGSPASPSTSARAAASRLHAPRIQR